MTMIIRTYYKKGLLFYISNPSESAFITVQLANDQLSVVYAANMDTADMQSVASITSDAHVTDGQWHTVSWHFFFAVVSFVLQLLF